MDSSQKRDRDRKKRQKRMEKLEKRKERALIKLHHREHPGAADGTQAEVAADPLATGTAEPVSPLEPTP